MRQYRIWSIEHTSWWRANSNGYSVNVEDAGIYSEEEALRIVGSANAFTVDEPHEAMVPITDNEGRVL
jgi:hypothetical protein